MRCALVEIDCVHQQYTTDYVVRFAKPEDIDRAGAGAAAEEDNGKSEDGFLSSSDEDEEGMDL